jgi:ABC-type polysaccharide/polyol phosphate export permease
MGLLDILNHVLNFCAPALWLAAWLPLLAKASVKKSSLTHSLLAQAAINTVVGLAVLLACLMLFGRDGKMLTYLVLVLCMASSQWFMLKGRRA